MLARYLAALWLQLQAVSYKEIGKPQDEAIAGSVDISIIRAPGVRVKSRNESTLERCIKEAQQETSAGRVRGSGLG